MYANVHRKMLALAGALLLAGCLRSEKPAQAGTRAPIPDGARDLTVGIVSDIHIWAFGDGAHRRFEKTLRYFRARQVDAVVVAGDLATQGFFDQLACVSNSWNEVFPNGFGENGKKVEPVFIYGNHDVAKWGGKTAEHIAKTWPTPALRRANVIFYDRSAAWKRAFGEAYEPISVKWIGGYAFVSVHFGEEAFLPAFLAKNRAQLAGDRPFFCVLHPHPSGTCHESVTWRYPALTEALSKFPNAVSLSGHSHWPVTDEKALWRGAFTSVGLGSLDYIQAPAILHMPNGYENTRSYSLEGKGRDVDGCREGKKMTPMVVPDASHGLVMHVRKDHLVFERFDFRPKVPIRVAEDWVVPTAGTDAGAAPFAARAKLEKAPEFRSDAPLKVSPAFARTHGFVQYSGWPIEPPVPADEKEGFCVWIPAADAVRGARAFEYEIVVETREQAEFGRCWALSAGFAKAPVDPANHRPLPVTIARELLPEGEMRFRVTPVTSLGTRGRACVSDWFVNRR